MCIKRIYILVISETVELKTAWLYDASIGIHRDTAVPA